MLANSCWRNSRQAKTDYSRMLSTAQRIFFTKLSTALARNVAGLLLVNAIGSGALFDEVGPFINGDAASRHQ